MIPEPQENSVELGPFLGHVTASSARVFIRIRPGQDLAAGVTATVHPAGPAPTRLTAWIDPRGAADGRTFVGDVPLPHGPAALHAIHLSLGNQRLGTLHARAAEPPADGGRIAFAFGSCWKPESSPDSDRIWRDLLALARGRIVDHLLLLGDQFYADESPLPSHPGATAVSRVLALGPASSLADRVAPFREACARAWSSPGLRRVQAVLPTTLIWDDHEIINSYGAMQEHFDLPGRALFGAAATAFDELQGSRNPPPLVPGSRTWGSRRGPAAFLALDLRTHRNFKEGILLGEEQRNGVRAWLESEARNARVLFVAASVPVLHLPKTFQVLGGIGDIRDQWENACRADRAWLLHLLRDFEDGGRRRAVVLGGDAHAASAAHLSDRSGHAIWQVVSSPLAGRLPLAVYPALRLLGRRFTVTASPSECLDAFIVRRWSGPNFGVVRGRVDDDRIELAFELYRPGRTTRLVQLVSPLTR